MLNLYFVKMSDQIEMSSAQTPSQGLFGSLSSSTNPRIFGSNTTPRGNPFSGGMRTNNDEINERIRNNELTERIRNNELNETIRNMVNKTWNPFNDEMSNNWKHYGSFAKWPKQMEQKPSDLVKSGFFYTGKGDLVTCFMCGLTLKDWECGDVVDIEHKKWSPGCKFLCAVSCV